MDYHLATMWYAETGESVGRSHPGRTPGEAEAAAIAGLQDYLSSMGVTNPRAEIEREMAQGVLQVHHSVVDEEEMAAIARSVAVRMLEIEKAAESHLRSIAGDVPDEDTAQLALEQWISDEYRSEQLELRTIRAITSSIARAHYGGDDDDS